MAFSHPAQSTTGRLPSSIPSTNPVTTHTALNLLLTNDQNLQHARLARPAHFQPAPFLAPSYPYSFTIQSSLRPDNHHYFLTYLSCYS